MKQLITLLILILFFHNSIFTQNLQITKADSLRDLGQLQLALEEHQLHFQAHPDDRRNTYNMACAFSMTRQRDSAFHYLNLIAEKDSTVRILNDADFYFLIDDDRWADIESKVIKCVEAKHGKYENLELTKELWRMKIKDQAFYYHFDVVENVADRNSLLNGALWELKSKINQENLERVEEIIAEHGWPKMSVVKGSAASTVFLIIQHADIDVQKKYLPVMREAADNGEASWRSLALLIDRVNLREGRKQIYGSQIQRKEDGTYMVRDMEEPEYVNQRRKEVGLGPIEDYVKRWGIVWDVVQKEKAPKP